MRQISTQARIGLISHHSPYYTTVAGFLRLRSMNSVDHSLERYDIVDEELRIAVQVGDSHWATRTSTCLRVSVHRREDSALRDVAIGEIDGWKAELKKLLFGHFDFYTNTILGNPNGGGTGWLAAKHGISLAIQSLLQHHDTKIHPHCVFWNSYVWCILH